MSEGHEKVFGICENKCMVETMSKEQINSETDSIQNKIKVLSLLSRVNVVAKARIAGVADNRTNFMVVLPTQLELTESDLDTLADVSIGYFENGYVTIESYGGFIMFELAGQYAAKDYPFSFLLKSDL